ncbi:MAG TPA: amino acid adenylation domain-containing protein [Ktedonobacteraceae bacterium]|nr:amino acid adenylation domain-containing protein [Ktedonobacteraceae bacterium]
MSFYNIGLTFRVQGSLSLLALRSSLSFLVERHEILRTTFITHAGEPMQRIASYGSVSLPVYDVSGLCVEPREEQARRLAQREVQNPFDLYRGPLMRALLIRLSQQEHLLLLTLHHTITDGWSQGVLLRELAAGYEAALQGQRPILAPLPIQYADYAVWQRKWMQGTKLTRQLAYWQQQLDGVSQVLELPTDRPRPPVQRHHGASISTSLPLSLARQVRQVSQREGVTPFMFLLSAFAILIARMSGQDDFLIGTAIAGRTRRELEGLMGFFVNTLPLRLQLHGHPTGRQLLERVREMTLQAYAHQEVPFEQIVEAFQPQRDLSRNPLLQVFFTLDNTPGEIPSFGGLTFTPVDNFVRSAHFDIDLLIVEVGEDLRVLLEYDTDLFEEATMQRMLERYQLLLELLLTSPRVEVDRLPWLLESERHQVLEQWNITSIPATDPRTLLDLFNQQVQSRPDSIALNSEQGQLSYGELDRRTNQLAHHLRKLGVGLDTPVGICIDRSLDLIVAIYGVLKAGGAYLPLDIDAPPLRQKQLLDNAHASICLFQERQTSLTLSSTITPVYTRDCELLERYPVTPPDVQTHPENLISIYFTSGSTGQPKGVASTHRGWFNRMMWMQQKYALQPGEAVLQKTTITFDDSAVEVYWPLSVGGQIALMDGGLHKDPQAILNAAIRYQVSILQFVPSILLLFLEQITPQASRELRYLRYVISSGEALRPELVRLFMERLACELHNQWGVTEVSIDSTEHTCGITDTTERGPLSIGHPITHNQVYILDAHLQPAPPGIAGDLYLAGAGLARGYLNDPARTAEVFLPHLLLPGERMYKTGDRGYYRPDGSIIFLGRQDEQVKVRGQRVELGEIEAVLSEHSEVQDCAVVARKQANEYRLIAYVVPSASWRGGGDQQKSWEIVEPLRHFLSERLPEYMIPGRFMLIDSLPTTTSGKINRKLLPDPGEERPELRADYIAPATETERKIVAIWEQVLGLSQVGIQDRFFDLGGHSLDATRAISQINSQLNVQIPLRALFEEPTVAGLTRRVHAENAQGDLGLPVSIPRIGPQENYAASHAQERLWLSYQLDPEHAYGAVLTLELEGELDREILEQALHSLVKRHSILRTTFVEREGQVRQIVHDELLLPYGYAGLSALSAGEQAAYLKQWAIQLRAVSFDLSQGPLFRVQLFKLAERKHHLTWSIHSIAFDSWSLGILMDDLAALYGIHAAGRSETELPQPLQYRDYAGWQNQRLSGGELYEQRRYWQEQLAGFLPSPRLPADGSVTRANAGASPYRLFTIESELTKKLYDFSIKHGVTLFMTLLAGLKMWLASTLRQTDIIVGSPVAGRVHADLEQVFGTLWNPVALRTDLSGNPDFVEVLERVSRTVLGAFAHQEYPFDLVVQDYRQSQGLEAPLYSVVLVLQNASKQELSFNDVRMCVSLAERLADGDGTAPEQFDDMLNAEFDLHIEAYELDGQIILATQYDPSRFYAETVDLWHVQIASILDQFVSQPDGRLSQLRLIDPNELDELFA